MYLNSYKPHGYVKCKNFISLTNVTREDLFEFMYRTREFKEKARVKEQTPYLTDKYVAIISKPAYFRSRIAFQIAVESLGGKPLVIPLSGPNIEQSLKDCDVMRNLCDFGISAFIVDTAYFHDAEVLETYALLPVINANAKAGPCHALSTLYTAWEKFGKLRGLKMAAVGNFSADDNSVLIGAAKCGVNLNIISPEDRAPSKRMTDYCRQFCNVELTSDLDDGIRGCNIVYVGENDFGSEFCVKEIDMSFAAKDAVLLHSFPLIRDKDVSDDAADCAQSLIFEQATNMIPSMKAALSFVATK